MSSEKEHVAVTNFRKYLRIQSVHPDVNYDECVNFIAEQAKGMGLPAKVIVVHPGKPIVIVTCPGTNPGLSSILLYSHMDVVPVEREFWSHDPFAAEKDANGNIYARGAQDMKSVGIQYLETLRRCQKEGLKLKRSIHVCFGPDEEIGGELGVGKFVKTDHFKELNVGVCLDEALADPTDEFVLAYTERSSWKVDIICRGTAGHGSAFYENTAPEKLQNVINKFMDFRLKEKQKLESNRELTLGDVTTVNLTMIKGGTQSNVLPAEIRATVDIRVAIDVDHDELETTIQKWCKEAGEDVFYKFASREPKKAVTPLDDTNQWWMAMKREFDRMKLKVKPIVFPGGTDSGKFIRKCDIPTFGFSAINNTPVLLHAHDEFLNERVFLKGLDIYYNIIKSLASV